MFEGKMKLDLIVLYLSAVLFHTFCLHLFNRTTMLVIILYIKTILLNLRTHMSHVRIFPCCFGLAFVKFCSLYEYEYVYAACVYMYILMDKSFEENKKKLR